MATSFAITFTISWGLGFSWAAIVQREEYLWLPVVSVAACGPAFAAILISAVTNTRPRQGTRRAFWVAFLTAWPLATLVFLANLAIVEGATLSPPAGRVTHLP